MCAAGADAVTFLGATAAAECAAGLCAAGAEAASTLGAAAAARGAAGLCAAGAEVATFLGAAAAAGSGAGLCAAGAEAASALSAAAAAGGDAGLGAAFVFTLDVVGCALLLFINSKDCKFGGRAFTGNGTCTLAPRAMNPAAMATAKLANMARGT